MPQTTLQTEPQYLGVPIFFAGKTWLVPSLSVLQYRQYIGVLSNPSPTMVISQDATPEQRAQIEIDEANKRFDTLLPIVGAALRRNYPDVTDADLEQQLDMNTFWLALKAVQSAAGLKAVKPGEAETQTAA